ncbi:hypothetical protein, partial [Azospirillum sp. A39]
MSTSQAPPSAGSYVEHLARPAIAVADRAVTGDIVAVVLFLVLIAAALAGLWIWRRPAVAPAQAAPNPQHGEETWSEAIQAVLRLERMVVAAGEATEHVEQETRVELRAMRADMVTMAATFDSSIRRVH